MTIDEQLRHAGQLVNAAMAAEPVPDVPTFRRSRRAAALGAAIVAALVGVVLFLTLTGQDRTELTTVATPANSVGAVPFGTNYVWPQIPRHATPTELALAFAHEVLGWETAGASLSEGVDSSGPVWVRLAQAGGGELVDVLTVPGNDETRAISEVGVPWATGISVDEIPQGQVGSRIELLRLANVVKAQISVRLENGTRETVTATDIDIRAGYVDAPQLADPGAIESIMALYLDETGRVIAATGSIDPASE